MHRSFRWHATVPLARALAANAHYNRLDICRILLNSTIASTTALPSTTSTVSSLTWMLVPVALNGDPKTGQTVPSAGNVPFSE